MLLIEDYYLSVPDKDREAVDREAVDRESAEKALLMKIVVKLNEYDWSMGFYTTGVRTYNPRKHKKVGRDSDLIQLDKRLRRYGMYSPVKQSEFTKIPYYVGYNNRHTHIDSYTIFANQVIRSSMFKDQYSAKDLDTIAKGIVGRGKYGGLKGVDFENIADLEEKRKYALEDAVLVKECVAKNNYELLHILNSMSRLTSVPFRNVCNSKGVTKLWNPINDEITDKVILDFGDVDVKENESRFNMFWNYRNKQPKFEAEAEAAEVEELEDPQEADDDDDDDNSTEEDNKEETKYIGGFVLVPNPAEYFDTDVVDVESLYPNMIVNFNTGWDSLNCDCCKDNPNAKIPSELFCYNSNKLQIGDYLNLNTENDPIPILGKTNKDKSKNWHICLKHRSIFADQIKYYMDKRLEFKHKKDELYKYTKEQLREFAMNAGAFKILINGGYGYLGFTFAKYNNLQAAEMVTRYGRYILRQIVQMAANEFGFTVTYGDTDSVFIVGVNNNDNDNDNDNELDMFIRKVRFQLNVGLEKDKHFDRLVLCKKKNYLGVSGHALKIVGLSGKKSNNCLWVRKVFNKMVEDYRDGIDPLINLKNELVKLEQHKIEDPETSLLMRINLSRDPEDYKIDNLKQKQIGLEKGLQDGETANYYIADPTKKDPKRKFTYNALEYSVKEYKNQLIRVVSQFLDVLKVDVENQLKMPSESLFDEYFENRNKQHKENSLMQSDDRDYVKHIDKSKSKSKNKTKQTTTKKTKTKTKKQLITIPVSEESLSLSCS